ncbi:unnamed protein product [Linum trigynum]|uniref:Uncharacterized protein n=1 Tax=Linum trigynum TaxID=586398 RepID=A0AAV2F2V5_9ROSI
MSESQMPNLGLKLGGAGNLKIDEGGKRESDELTTAVMIRGSGSLRNFDSRPSASNGDLELCYRSLTSKAPNSRSNDINLVLQTCVLEQPFSDPIWSQFCERFEQKRNQVLRATLFQERGPDMIPLGSIFKPERIEKEASSTTCYNAEFLLCPLTVSGCPVYTSGTFYWLDGNPSLKAYCEDKVTYYTMECFGAQTKTQSIVFQGPQNGMSQLGNDQNLPKSGNQFGYPTLKVNACRISGTRSKRALLHQSTSFILQRRGIG